MKIFQPTVLTVEQDIQYFVNGFNHFVWQTVKTVLVSLWAAPQLKLWVEKCTIADGFINLKKNRKKYAQKIVTDFFNKKIEEKHFIIFLQK